MGYIEKKTAEMVALGKIIESDEKQHRVAYRLTTAIIDVIGRTSPFPAHRTAKELFREWCEDGDGELAITSLVNLIIHQPQCKGYSR